MSSQSSFQFEAFRLHPTQGLRRGETEVHLTPKALAVLHVLVSRAGQVVTKEELFQEVWPGTVVSDGALSSCILELRKAFGDDAREPHYIETLHRRGFRFLPQIAARNEVGGDASDRSAEVTRAALHFQRAVDFDREKKTQQSLRDRWQQALLMLERQPSSPERDRQEAVVRVQLGQSLAAVHPVGDPHLEAHYQRSLDLCRRLGYDVAPVEAIWGLWIYYFNRGPLRIAEELVEALNGVARASSEESLRLQARHASGPTALVLGRVQEVQTSALRPSGPRPDDSSGLSFGCALHNAARENHDVFVCSGSFRALAEALGGCMDAARLGVERVVERARTLSDAFTLALALTQAGATFLIMRDSRARAHAAEASRLARDHRFHLVWAWASIYEGRALADQGDAAHGMALMREGLATAREIGSTLFRPLQLALIAEAQCHEGLYAEAALSLQEAEDITSQTGERLSIAEVQRVKAKLRFAMGSDAASRDRARTALRTAMAVAHQQGAFLLELRAAVTLGTLLGDGEDDAAEAMESVTAAAAHVHGPSPDTADARALLDRLRAA